MCKLSKKLNSLPHNCSSLDYDRNNIIDNTKLNIVKPDRVLNFNACKVTKYERAYLEETIIEVRINKLKFWALFDSGSEASLISEIYVNKYFPEWKKYEDLVNAPESGRGVNGKHFNIVGTKLFYVEIGNFKSLVPLCISPINQGIIFGLDILKTFNISLIFSPEKIRIFQSEVYLHTKFENDKHRAVNSMKITLYPNQKKLVSFYSSNIVEGEDYVGHAHHSSPSVVLPSISKGSNNVLYLVVKNDSRKKVCFKKNEIMVNLIKFDGEIRNLTNLDTLSMMKSTCNLPIPFYNEKCEFNKVYYSVENENILRCNFFNNVFAEPNKKEEKSEKDSLKELSQLEGIEIPQFHFPIRSVQEILDNDLNSSLKPEHRTFLIALLNKYPNLISQFSYDCGELRSYNGDKILMDIPLKGEIPRLTKAYKLSDNEQEALNDILNFLIFFGLAENVDSNSNYGSPVFLVDRQSSNRPPRLIFDVRKINEYIDAPTSTYSTCVFDPLTDIVEKADWLTHLDISNAYFSIKLSEKTLKTNISNIYCTDRTVKMYSPLTGFSLIPLWWSNVINKELNLNDFGIFDPLEKEGSLFRAWIDDLLTASAGSDNRHKTELVKFIHRLARLGVKINIKKSNFFINIKEDSFSLLGFDIKKGRIVPNSMKLDCISHFKRPTSTKELQKFLGMMNFIRNVLPLQIIHLTTILYPLSSNIKPFLWEEKHSIAFEKIKEILKTNFNYTEARLKNAINIIYTDASTSLMGGICFNYNTENIIADPPPDLINNRTVFLNQLNHYKINCKTVPLVKLDNEFESFILLILKCIYIHEKKDLGKMTLIYF